MQTNESYYLMPYNSRADVVLLLAEWYNTQSDVNLGEFQVPYVSSHTEELWYNETFCLWITIYIYYIYIYIYIYIYVYLNLVANHVFWYYDLTLFLDTL